MAKSTSLVVMMTVVVLVLGMVVGRGRADFASDRAECADRLMGLATCLTYVEEQATARAPTPDCCAGLKQVLQASKKCLCVLVRDRDNPSLGFKINVTRAMGLPALCSIPAEFSDCPKLLNISPDSKEAQIFKDYAKQAAPHGSTSPPTASGSANGGKSASAAASSDTHKSGAAAGAGRMTRWLGSCFYLASPVAFSFLLAYAY